MLPSLVTQSTEFTKPSVFTKSQKFALRRSHENYKPVKSKLYYKEQIQDGSDRDRLLKSSEADRVFSNVTSLQEDTEGGMLPQGKQNRDIVGQIFTKKSRRRYTQLTQATFTLNIARYMAYICTCNYVASYAVQLWTVTIHWTRLLY